MREIARKLIHMAVGLGAFAVVYLGPLYSALGVSGLVLFNLFVLPRVGGRRLWRKDESRRGTATGIVLYPLVVLALLLVFWRRPEVAAAVWAVLAFGDGAAALAGRLIGGARLPWNPDKSWAGSLACWLFGAAGCAAALGWTMAHQGREIAPPFLIAVSALAALLAAWIESQPQGLDDNLTLPVLTAAFLWGALPSASYWTDIDPSRLLVSAAAGAVTTLGLALIAYLVKAIDVSGAVAGVVLGTVIATFLGARGLLVLAAFVALGSAATRIGYRRKARKRLAQEAGGRRGAGHAVANAGVAAVVAAFAATTPHAGIYLPAFAAALAAAAGDTLSSELGQLWGRRTVLITTWEPVRRGTDGGVSLAGTAAGLGGAAAIAALGWAVGFYPPATIAAVTLAGVAGTLADSLAGATLERRGLLDNHAVNLLNTLVGAGVAAGLAAGLS